MQVISFALRGFRLRSASFAGQIAAILSIAGKSLMVIQRVILTNKLTKPVLPDLIRYPEIPCTACPAFLSDVELESISYNQYRVLNRRRNVVAVFLPTDELLAMVW